LAIRVLLPHSVCRGIRVGNDHLRGVHHPPFQPKQVSFPKPAVNTISRIVAQGIPEIGHPGKMVPSRQPPACQMRSHRREGREHSYRRTLFAITKRLSGAGCMYRPVDPYRTWPQEFSHAPLELSSESLSANGIPVRHGFYIRPYFAGTVRGSDHVASDPLPG
jgi:hypothetical protein